MQKNKRFSVFWFDPSPTIGTELQKVRPCIVLSPETMNRVVGTVIIVPLTSAAKSWPFRAEVMVGGRRSGAACEQIRAVDKSRLKDYITTLSPGDGRTVLRILQETFAD